MILHRKEQALDNGQSVTYIFDETGTTQGYVQGSSKSWRAYMGTKGDLLDTFTSKEEALDILTEVITG